MLIQNKTAIFLGDSITEGAGASKIDNAYWNVLKRNIGLKQVIGYGKPIKQVNLFVLL